MVGELQIHIYRTLFDKKKGLRESVADDIMKMLKEGGIKYVRKVKKDEMYCTEFGIKKRVVVNVGITDLEQMGLFLELIEGYGVDLIIDQPGFPGRV